MIEFKNVTKKYDSKTTALNDVNLTIEKGEFVFIVGSSGAGKSTFLKLMMREEVPTSGTITVDGIVLNKMRRRAIPKFRRKLGIVFQDFRLIPTMTVFDNIAFAMRVIGTKQKKIRRRVPYLLSLMGLSDKARNYPRELSGGEQQRVALARALANDAEIIIADEPTGNVDPQMSYEIVDLLMRLNESGVTVIMVTHEHSLVRRFDKRVIILDKGCVISDGEILDHEAATSHINAGAEIPSVTSEQAAEKIKSEQEAPGNADPVEYEDIVSDSALDPVTKTVDIEEYDTGSVQEYSSNPEESLPADLEADLVVDTAEIVESPADPDDVFALAESEIGDSAETEGGEADD